MRVLFLGSSHFSKLVLENMLKEGINVCYVITQPDRPSGRGYKLMPTEVKKYATERGIEVFTFDKLKLHMEEVKKLNFDVSVVASYGQILPEEFLNILCINVHPSLLPKYRGASPLQNTLLNGDKEGGVTIMKVAKEVDAGDIIAQERVAINGEYYRELEEKLGVLGGKMIAKVIKDLQQGRISFTPQDNAQASYVKKFKKEDGNIDFSQSGEEIVNRVRALSEELGTQFYIDDVKIKVEKAKDVSDEFFLQPFEILNSKKRFIVGCKNGAVEILQCLAPSGKSVSGRDFLNGHSDLINKQVKNA